MLQRWARLTAIALTDAEFCIDAGLQAPAANSSPRRFRRGARMSQMSNTKHKTRFVPWPLSSKKRLSNATTQQRGIPISQFRSAALARGWRHPSPSRSSVGMMKEEGGEGQAVKSCNYASYAETKRRFQTPILRTLKPPRGASGESVD